MLTLEDAKEIVEKRGWLSRTPEEFRRAVLTRVTLRAYKPGEAVYSINDPPGGMYGLAAGSAKISMAPGEDGPYVFHMMTPGAWNGYGPTIAGCNRIVGLSAGRNCQMLFLPLHAFNEIAAGEPLAWRHLAGLALSDTQTALGVIDDLMIRDEFRRFLAVLLRNCDCRNGAEEGRNEATLDVNQSELASMCNLSRTTTGAFLRRLEAAGQVEIRYGQIGVLAPAALRALLADGH